MKSFFNLKCNTQNGKQSFLLTQTPRLHGPETSTLRILAELCGAHMNVLLQSSFLLPLLCTLLSPPGMISECFVVGVVSTTPFLKPACHPTPRHNHGATLDTGASTVPTVRSDKPRRSARTWPGLHAPCGQGTCLVNPQKHNPGERRGAFSVLADDAVLSSKEAAPTAMPAICGNQPGRASLGHPTFRK